MMNSFSIYWRRIAAGAHHGISDRLLLAFLLPFSLVYALVQHLRAWSYRVGILEIRSLPRPVISIGNLTVGGTGKTPVTAHIARMLMAQGLNVAVLTRGYGGAREGSTAVVSDGSRLMLSAEECGDEAYLLASSVPGLMVVIGTDRHAAGLLALESLSPDIFLLDDGFQHLRLYRDLNILLMDCAKPFGNGLCLPAGLMREPASAAARADFIMFTRCPKGDVPGTAITEIPSCHLRHEIGDVVSLTGDHVFTLDSLRDRRLLVFAGIADPSTFATGLREKGLNVVASLNLPDHVTYSEDVVMEIVTAFGTAGADYAVTTEKDGVKLTRLPDTIASKVLLARLELSFVDPAPLSTLLRNLLQK